MRRLGVLVGALLVLAGCGSSGGGHVAKTQTVAGPLLQVANGPARGRRPLTLQLDTAADPIVVPFKQPPRSGVLFDLDTGEVLWRRLPDRILPIASLTKMMTALLVVQRSKHDDKVRVT